MSPDVGLPPRDRARERRVAGQQMRAAKDRAARWPASQQAGSVGTCGASARLLQPPVGDRHPATFPWHPSNTPSLVRAGAVASASSPRRRAARTNCCGATAATACAITCRADRHVRHAPRRSPRRRGGRPLTGAALAQLAASNTGTVARVGSTAPWTRLHGGTAELRACGGAAASPRAGSRRRRRDAAPAGGSAGSAPRAAVWIPSGARTAGAWLASASHAGAASRDSRLTSSGSTTGAFARCRRPDPEQRSRRSPDASQIAYGTARASD